MQDETRRDSDRLEASRLLADRGWEKAAAYEPRKATRSTLPTWSRRRRSSGRRSFASRAIRNQIPNAAREPVAPWVAPEVPCPCFCSDIRLEQEGSAMGRAGIEPATLGLKVPCSTN